MLMIDPFDLWNSFQSLVNTFQGGWFRPQTDFIQACNDLSKKFWVKYTDEAYKSQRAKDNLMPFAKTHNYKVDNSGVRAFFKVDKDYGRFSSAWIVVHNSQCVPDPKIEDGKCVNVDFEDKETITQDYYDELKAFEVDLIDDIKWASVNQHKTKGPRLDKPYIRQVEGGFQILPRKISAITVSYWREPKPATFNYTLSPGNVQTGAGDQIIYNTNSDPLEWPFSMRDDFLMELGIRYSLFTREQFLFAASQQQKTT